MTGPVADRWTLRGYRLLLGLYPRSFRRPYGTEAERVLRDLLGTGAAAPSAFSACGRASSATCCRPRSRSGAPR
jgi:hypothetical protein